MAPSRQQDNKRERGQHVALTKQQESHQQQNTDAQQGLMRNGDHSNRGSPNAGRCVSRKRTSHVCGSEGEPRGRSSDCRETGQQQISAVYSHNLSVSPTLGANVQEVMPE